MWTTRRVGLVLWLVASAALGGCASDDESAAGWFRGPDGGRHLSTCAAPDINMDACGVVEGQPYYGFYWNCNWCNCREGAVSCTARGCQPDPNDPSVTYEAFDGQCTPLSFGAAPTPTEGETWTCDEEGRLFRSACVP